MKTTIDMAREAGADTLMYWDIEKLKRFEALVLANKRAAPVQEPVAWTDEQLQMLNFLYGAGEWDGLWFDQKHPAKKGAFWWRSDLRRLFTAPPAAQPAPVQPVQEPVAWMYPDDYERMTTSETFCTVYSVEVGSATRGESTIALYTTPPAQPAPVQEPVATYTCEDCGVSMSM